MKEMVPEQPVRKPNQELYLTKKVSPIYQPVPINRDYSQAFKARQSPPRYTERPEPTPTDVFLHALNYGAEGFKEDGSINKSFD